LIASSAFAQPKVIAKIQEGEKVLFEGTLLEEEVIQIPARGNLLKVELTFQSYDQVQLYIGGDFIVKEISSASLLAKAHKIVLEKTPSTTMMGIHLSMIAEAGKTILAIYDGEGKPIAIFRKSPSMSVNESTVANVRRLIASLQNALESSILPEGLKAKYKEDLYKSAVLLEEDRTSEAERLISEALESLETEETKFKRIAEEIAQTRKALIGKVSSSSLSNERISKAVTLLNSAEEELKRGSYDQAEILIAQANSVLNPSLLDQLTGYLPLLTDIAFLILAVSASIYFASKVSRKAREKELIPSQRAPEW
jgi:hypothetical protein